jgi:hypothetical protein
MKCKVKTDPTVEGNRSLRAPAWPVEAGVLARLRNQLLLRQRERICRRLHRGLPMTPAPLMRPHCVVLLNEVVGIGLELRQALVARPAAPR